LSEYALLLSKCNKDLKRSIESANRCYDNAMNAMKFRVGTLSIFFKVSKEIIIVMNVI